MLRRFRLACAALVLLSGCTSNTDPAGALSVDPNLTLETARARWLAVQAVDYEFEFRTQGCWFMTPDYFHAVVADRRLVEVRHTGTAAYEPLQKGFTIDELFDRLLTAKARGEVLSQLQFSREGIPMQAAVNNCAADAGVQYYVRSFVTR